MMYTYFDINNVKGHSGDVDNIWYWPWEISQESSVYSLLFIHHLLCFSRWIIIILKWNQSGLWPSQGDISWFWWSFIFVTDNVERREDCMPVLHTNFIIWNFLTSKIICLRESSKLVRLLQEDWKIDMVHSM